MMPSRQSQSGSRRTGATKIKDAQISTQQYTYQLFTAISASLNQNCHFRETTYPVIDAHAGVCKKVKFLQVPTYLLSSKFQLICYPPSSKLSFIFQVPIYLLSPKSQFIFYPPSSNLSFFPQVPTYLLSPKFQLIFYPPVPNCLLSPNFFCTLLAFV